MIIVNLSVLARPSDTLSTRQPTPEGRAIWSMLFDKYMGRIIVASDEAYDLPALADWLKVEGYKPSMFEVIDEPLPDLKAQRIHRLGSLFGRIQWYVDTDPRVCAHTIALGIPSLVVACPYVVRPEWVQEKDIRKWDNLVEEMESQALKAAEKTWRD